MDFKVLGMSDFIEGTIKTLRKAEVIRGDTSAIKALDKLSDYISKGRVEYAIEGGELRVFSSDTASGKGRDGDLYVAGPQRCTCPGGTRRLEAQRHNAASPDQPKKVICCWHIQLARLLKMAEAQRSIVSDMLMDLILPVHKPAQDLDGQSETVYTGPVVSISDIGKISAA